MVRDVSLTAVWQPTERNSSNMTLNSEVDRYNDLAEFVFSRNNAKLLARVKLEILDKD